MGEYVTPTAMFSLAKAYIKSKRDWLVLVRGSSFGRNFSSAEDRLMDR